MGPTDEELADLERAREQVAASRELVRHREEVELLQARKDLERSRAALHDGGGRPMRVSKQEKTRRRAKAKAAKRARRRSRA